MKAEANFSKARRLDNGEWIEGQPLFTKHNAIIVTGVYHLIDYQATCEIDHVFEVNPETVCKCTGKMFKGKFLFEGDRFQLKDGLIKVVRYNPKSISFEIANEKDIKDPFIVKMFGEALWHNASEEWFKLFEKEITIIGNIHDDKIIEFTASRLTKGNPVRGVFVSQDDEWITVRLLHDIAGIRNKWLAGEEKQFRLSLINGTIKGL